MMVKNDPFALAGDDGTEKLNPRKTLPVAYLAGVIENSGEYDACSLVFVLETEHGHTINLNYEMLMQALRFAEEQGVMPELTTEWWAGTALAGHFFR
jgi:hypothetical protein